MSEIKIKIKIKSDVRSTKGDSNASSFSGQSECSSAIGSFNQPTVIENEPLQITDDSNGVVEEANELSSSLSSISSSLSSNDNNNNNDVVVTKQPQNNSNEMMGGFSSSGSSSISSSSSVSSQGSSQPRTSTYKSSTSSSTTPSSTIIKTATPSPSTTTKPTSTTTTYTPSKTYDNDVFNIIACAVGILASFVLLLTCICTFIAKVTLTRDVGGFSPYTHTVDIKTLSSGVHGFAVFLLIVALIFIPVHIVRLIKGGNRVIPIVYFAILTLLSFIAMVSFFGIKDHNYYSGDTVYSWKPDIVYNITGVFYVLVFIDYVATLVLSIISKVKND